MNRNQNNYKDLFLALVMYWLGNYGVPIVHHMKLKLKETLNLYKFGHINVHRYAWKHLNLKFPTCLNERLSNLVKVSGDHQRSWFQSEIKTHIEWFAISEKSMNINIELDFTPLPTLKPYFSKRVRRNISHRWIF